VLCLHCYQPLIAVAAGRPHYRPPTHTAGRPGRGPLLPGRRGGGPEEGHAAVCAGPRMGGGIWGGGSV